MSFQSLTCGCDPATGAKCPAHTPAFPSGMIDCGSCWEKWPYLGLTLRDYFAAKALPVIMQASDIQDVLSWDVWATKVADAAYDVADAMLTEREKRERTQEQPRLMAQLLNSLHDTGE